MTPHPPPVSRDSGQGIRSAVAELVASVRERKPRAIARAISWIENGEVAAMELAAACAALQSGVAVVGLTGAPGVGKSTTVTALVSQWRAMDLRVGVLAVDPSSPFSGGALLGDRVRMQAHANDRDVVIRSMATRGMLGGLAAAVPQAIRVLDVAGCDVVVVETVGVGQSEVDVADVCDTTCVLTAPGGGDQIQAAKAGLMEIGDIFVVNKAERDGAQALIRDLRSMIALGQRREGAWKPPIVATTASTGTGIDDLAQQIAAHRSHGEADGTWRRRRERRAEVEIRSLVLGRLERLSRRQVNQELLVQLGSAVATGTIDVYRAADDLAAAMGLAELAQTK